MISAPAVVARSNLSTTCPSSSGSGVSRARPRGLRPSSTERFERISQQIREQIARNDAERQRKIDA